MIGGFLIFSKAVSPSNTRHSNLLCACVRVHVCVCIYIFACDFEVSRGFLFFFFFCHRKVVTLSCPKYLGLAKIPLVRDVRASFKFQPPATS